MNKYLRRSDWSGSPGEGGVPSDVTGLYSAYPHLDTDFNWDNGIDTETGESGSTIPIRDKTTLRHLDSVRLGETCVKLEAANMDTAALADCMCLMCCW